MKMLMLIAVLALSVNAHAEKWEYMGLYRMYFYDADGIPNPDSSGFEVEGNFQGQRIKIRWTFKDIAEKALQL